MNIELKKNAVDWINQFSLSHPQKGWVIGFRLSTVPIENWFYKRNQLKEDSIKFDLTVPDYGLWVATLERHDGLFQVQWRPDNDLRVESQQLKYRKMVKWPHLSELSAFPDFVSNVESALNVKFIPHVDISSRLVDTNELITNDKVKQWLAPCCESVGHFMQR